MTPHDDTRTCTGHAHHIGTSVNRIAVGADHCSVLAIIYDAS